MKPIGYMPHISVLLQALRINRERLASRTKMAIDARLLRQLLQTIAAALPFSEEFYLETYPDLSESYAAGNIGDLHRHFVEQGFFEGRFGFPPQVDEAFYTGLYKDVAEAVRRGDVKSGTEHYLRSGAAEGRVPNAQVQPDVEHWGAVMRGEDARV